MSRYHTESLFSSDRTEQTSFNHIIRVAFEAGVDAQFDYLVADKFWPIAVGQRVKQDSVLKPILLLTSLTLPTREKEN
jgi:hypothetical protein